MAVVHPHSERSEGQLPGSFLGVSRERLQVDLRDPSKKVGAGVAGVAGAAEADAERANYFGITRDSLNRAAISVTDSQLARGKLSGNGSRDRPGRNPRQEVPTKLPSSSQVIHYA